MFESEIDIDFDLFDLDINDFDKCILDFLDGDGKTKNFYELKSKNSVVDKHQT